MDAHIDRVLDCGLPIEPSKRLGKLAGWGAVSSRLRIRHAFGVKTHEISDISFGMNQSAFRFAFTLGPLLIVSFVPSILFGILIDQWGSNLVWGSIFGLGWCLSAFAAGGLMHNDSATAGGLLWAWLVPIGLFFGSGWLWKNLSEHRRKIALMVLAFTFLLDVPAKTIMNWDAHHFHLPDFTLHLAESY